MKIFSASNILFKVLVVSAIGFFNPLKGTAQQVITLQQAVDSTLKNNLRIMQAQFSAALSNESLIQSRNALLPTLNASTNPSLNFGRGLDQNTFQVVNQTSFFLNASVSSNVTLFDGFAKINQIRQNKLLLEADKTNVSKVRNDLILEVVTSYLQVLFNIDLLKTSEGQLTIANQTLKREQELLNAGNKTLADLSQAKSQVSTAELNVTTALNALEISYLTLGQLMELNPNQKFVVQAPVYDETGNVKANVNPNEVYRSALDAFPDIKLVNLRAEAAKKGIDIAKGNYYPSLSLGGSMSSSYSFRFNDHSVNPITGLPIAQPSLSEQFSDRFGQGLGLSIQIPIFNGFNTRSAVRRAKINYENALLDEQVSKNSLRKIIYQATADLKGAESAYRSRTNTFVAQGDAFRAIELRYNEGLVNSLEYNTALTNMNKAEIDMIQAKYDLLFKAKVIDYYLGKQITF